MVKLSCCDPPPDDEQRCLPGRLALRLMAVTASEVVVVAVRAARKQSS